MKNVLESGKAKTYFSPNVGGVWIVDGITRTDGRNKLANGVVSFITKFDENSQDSGRLSSDTGFACSMWMGWTSVF